MTQTRFEDAYAGPVVFPPLYGDGPNTTDLDRDPHQTELRQTLASALYGPIPPRPDHFRVTREPIPGEDAERLVIDLEVANRRFSVDAAVWLPKARYSPAPLICGLDFVGPAGILTSQSFPLDPDAVVFSRPEFGAPEGQIGETLRGTSTCRWPVQIMLNEGYAVMVSCYGSWVPDSKEAWQSHGVYPLLRPERPTGAISLWAWAIRAMLDAAGTIEEIDSNRAVTAGHSRLGKAALWAAANDARFKAVFAHASGCGGAAPALHPIGETLSQMAERFPHWTTLGLLGSAAGIPAVDQHYLLSLLAPRAVYLSGATGDLWADPVGTYLALKAASDFWPDNKSLSDWPLPQEMWATQRDLRIGALGYHLRDGGHDLLPNDWSKFLNFLEVIDGF